MQTIGYAVNRKMFRISCIYEYNKISVTHTVTNYAKWAMEKWNYAIHRFII